MTEPSLEDADVKDNQYQNDDGHSVHGSTVVLEASRVSLQINIAISASTRQSQTRYTVCDILQNGIGVITHPHNRFQRPERDRLQKY